MPLPTPDDVRTHLVSFPDPESGRPITRMEQLGSVDTVDDKVRVELGLTTWSAPIQEEVCEELRKELCDAFSLLPEQVEVAIVPHERPADKLGQVGVTAKSVIAVGSGKGGVGKSSIAASVAFGLRNAGCKVGLLDADVYGPSVPHLLGVNQRPAVENQRIRPIEKDGLRVMSMGFMTPPDQAVVWRGPMLHGAVTQMLRDTEWGDLDYLIIDMPPGTGDVALTLSQLLPLTGAVVVCTPQDVALLDAVKAIAMFRKVNIPLLGVVENMSYFLCPDNGKRYDIFGNGGAKAKAAELGVPFLGEAPIHIDLRKRGDDGLTRENYADDVIAPFLWEITRGVVRNVAALRRESPQTASLPIL